MTDQETRNGDMLNRATVFYADLEKAAYSAAEKVSQDLVAVIRIGEMKQELRDTYRHLEDIEQWFSNKGRGWLSFWRLSEKSAKRTERVLTITLFDLLADRLGMPHYDTLRAQ